MVPDNEPNGTVTTNSLLREVLRDVRDQGKEIASLSTKIDTFAQEIIRLRDGSHEMAGHMTKEGFRINKLEGRQEKIAGELEELRVRQKAIESLPELARNRFHLYVTSALGGSVVSLIGFLIERAFH